MPDIESSPSDPRLRSILPIYELSRAFMGTFRLEDFLNQIVISVRDETQAEVVSLMLIDENNPSQLRIAAATGLPAEIVATHRSHVGEGIAGYVVKTGNPLMLADGMTLSPEIRQAMRKPDLLSSLCLPLRVRDNIIGVLNVARRRGSTAFAQSDMELATVFAGQAAVAIDQVRLIAQLRRLSDISQQLARAIDLDEACAVILNAPIEMMSAGGTALWLDEGPAGTTVKKHGLENIVLPEISLDRRAEEFLADAAGSWLKLPLLHGDKVFGVLGVRFNTSLALGQERLDTLRTIAHLASAVIESHRLRAREAQAFREVERVVRSDLNLRDLLDRLLSEMMATCEASSGTIFLWNDERKELEPWVTRGTAVAKHCAQEIADSGKGQQSIDEGRCVIGAPMMTGSHAEGAALVARDCAAGDFRPQQVEFLSTLASAAALMVRNAQLYARSEEAAIAEERTRIARELHDSLAQDLSYLVLKIDVAQRLLTQNKDKELRKELTDISAQLRRDSRDVRRIIFALRPLEIETLGFLPALQEFVKEFGKINEIEIQLNVLGELAHLPPKLETALFRLTQEALTNIRKHAQATHAWIDITSQDHSWLVLRVRDDGVGFELASALEAARARGSLGLRQMRERAERAGGKCAIHTAPGKGTAIQIELPIREAT